MSPDLAWPSGSDLEWPWTDPDPDLYRLGSDLDRVGSDLDRFGSDLERIWSGLDRIGSACIGFGSDWIGFGLDLNRIWKESGSDYDEKSLFFLRNL